MVRHLRGSVQRGSKGKDERSQPADGEDVDEAQRCSVAAVDEGSVDGEIAFDRDQRDDERGGVARKLRDGCVEVAREGAELEQRDVRVEGHGDGNAGGDEVSTGQPDH